MSLLLDALKKAADDKQKAAQHDPADTSPAGTTSDDDLASDRSAVDEAVTLPDKDEQHEAAVSHVATQATTQAADEAPVRETDESAEELTLDEIEPVSEVAKTDTPDVSADAANGDEPDMDEKPRLTETEKLTLQQSAEESAEQTSYTVSDEALSMLIYKTNRDVKQGKRIVVAGMLFTSFVVLAAGGVYYYLDMQAEIAMLERKHQIAMQSMKSKTSKQNAPEQSEIIRSLVSESDLDDKVQYAKQRMAAEKNTQRATRTAAAAKNKVNTDAVVSFQKTNKADPVTEKLEAAWAAYDSAQYERAKRLYREILSVEKENRDALLGLGAIAIIEKNNIAARDIYMLLLRHDPRDSIAISALASLQDGETFTEADEKYLQDMLQKNPDDAHLNFALGNVYAQQQKWKLAQQSYFDAWQRDNKNADYIFNLAVSLDQLGKQKQAVDFYQDSLDQSAGRNVSFSREAVQQRLTEIKGL